MFIKFRVKSAIAKFLVSNRLNGETLRFFESGPIEAFMPLVERNNYDGNQGAVAVITATITAGAKNGVLTQLKTNAPHVYRDLVELWRYCGYLASQDERQFGDAVIVGDLADNPFEHAERDAVIQSVLDKY